MKAAVSTVLLLFVAVSLAYVVVGDRSSEADLNDGPVARTAPDTGGTAMPDSSATPASEEKLAEDPERKLVAYFFHGDDRCKRCRAMERYAREVIDQSFADEVKQGAIEWRAVNFDQPTNEHYIKTYDLSASAVVVVSTVDGRPVHWRNLELIWNLGGDETAYKAYILKEVTEMVERGS